MHQAFSRIRSETVNRVIEQHADPQLLAKYVLKLSDRYNNEQLDHSEIWNNKDLSEAYFNYFLPLNALRLKSVFVECEKLGFLTGIQSLHDIGSGPGTSDLALSDLDLKFKSLNFYDRNSRAFEIHKSWLTKLSHNAHSRSHRKWSVLTPEQFSAQDLVVFSYSHVEMTAQLPQLQTAGALIFLEPSLRNTGRRLMELRNQMLASGFHVWAPCTHQLGCPMLLHSKTDWCHQRIHVDLPPPLEELERFLPMKNRSLTYSYLCLSKTKPPDSNHVRVVGDTLYEKGKVKQAVCRNSEREFLSWLTKNGEPPVIARGSLIELPTNIEQKNSELRWPT